MSRILRVLRSRSLPCGCFVGYYETYAGETIVIVEEHGRACQEPAHQAGRPVADKPWGVDGEAQHLAS